MSRPRRALAPSICLLCQSKRIHRSHSGPRFFSHSPKSQLRSSELTDSHFASLRAQSDRLWSDIHHTAQWGPGRRYGEQPEQTGMSRLTLSDADKEARAWFARTAESLSCKTYLDAVGNQFAIRPGLTNDSSAIFVGSHLDTQPTGGRFDGVLGVCAGIEMLRVLDENWIETEGPVGVVNWTNEEGARFPKSIMGSAVWAGETDLEKTYDLKEVGSPPGGPKTVREELERIGALGDVPANWRTGIKLGAHFELHIEQGPHLTNAKEPVGAVVGVQAYKWFSITITGRDCHTGTTAYEHRADALYWAARLILAFPEIAAKYGGLASVGIIKAEPGSINTVPGLVTMSLDIRHTNDGKCKAMETAIRKYLSEIAETSKSNGAPGVTLNMVQTFDSPAVRFNKTAIECVEKAGKSVTPGTKDIRRMTSGAGHDSVSTSRKCPTAMIFVPCKDGVSHHPEEWCEKEDCAVGASVLIESVLRFDRIRHDKGEFE